MTVNDIYAAEIIKEAQRRNLKIPADFQLIGYDNNVLCEYTTPTISTIDQQPKLIGQTAARRLLDLINGKKSSQNSIINVIPIKRNSTY
ncbi:substrate-binding domain-containing protein [Lactobacillus sp. R2/2]|nr:substrate-binding domain-containing protein [Lactobacillus sp. R2/2]